MSSDETIIMIKNVYARGSEKNNFQLNMPKGANILGVKTEIANRIPNMPADSQKLIYRGKICTNDSKLKDVLSMVSVCSHVINASFK